MNKYKQVIVMRADLRMSKGKMAVQASHAAVSALRRAEKLDDKVIKHWEKYGQKKIVLQVAGVKELQDLKKKCDELKIPSVIITDAGLTELKSGTVTALGVGPAEEKKIDKITGALPLLK